MYGRDPPRDDNISDDQTTPRRGSYQQQPSESDRYLTVPTQDYGAQPRPLSAPPYGNTAQAFAPPSAFAPPNLPPQESSRHPRFPVPILPSQPRELDPPGLFDYDEDSLSTTPRLQPRTTIAPQPIAGQMPSYSSSSSSRSSDYGSSSRGGYGYASSGSSSRSAAISQVSSGFIYVLS
jgi:hypothetical protein